MLGLVQSCLQTKIEQIDAQIQEILVFKAALEDYRDRWRTHQPDPKPGTICPLIKTMSWLKHKAE